MFDKYWRNLPKGLQVFATMRSVMAHENLRPIFSSVTAAVLVASLVGSPTTAIAADSELCPTSVKIQSTTGTWPNLLNTYNDSGFTSESGTLAGCANPVSVIAPNKTDYYLYFDAASLSGKDLFGESGDLLRFSVSGAPGAAGWYVQAFLTDGTQLSKTYGGGGSDGRINYGHSLTLPDLTTSTQPTNAGTASSPSPTYSVEYGYTLTSSQKASVLNGELAIYIGYLGSSVTGANDTLSSVKLLYTSPSGSDSGTPERSRGGSEILGAPGTFLTLTGRSGQEIEDSSVIFGSDRLTNGRGFSLRVLDDRRRLIAKLSEGSIPDNGSFESTLPLPAIPPGQYTLEYLVKTEEGHTLTLRNTFSVNEELKLIQQTEESSQPEI